MKAGQAIEALGSLAQETRLTIFRLLVQRGPPGLPAGTIADKVGIPSSSLSFHLQHLTRAGLIGREHRGGSASRRGLWTDERAGGLPHRELLRRGSVCPPACDEAPSARKTRRPRMRLLGRASAEMAGTAFLLIAIVGSESWERLSAGSIGLALLANSLATGAALLALILALGHVSGAQLNPLVTLLAASSGERPWREVPAYVAAQVGGAILGVATAHGMFGLPVFSASHHPRSGLGQMLGEAVATVGLLSVVGLVRPRSMAAPAIAAYITGAYWFTSSTSFANPAVTLARGLTDTFAGVRPSDIPGLWLGQLVGALIGVGLLRLARAHPEAMEGARGR